MMYMMNLSMGNLYINDISIRFNEGTIGPDIAIAGSDPKILSR